ncbi:MAG: hypothetical protein PHH00_00175 [Candidatus Nanoarchaeia archaeon]|nr:hypothetical protein [Candidatus Nanoarchaeia archaeon]
MKKSSKKEAEKKISEFLLDIKNKTPDEVKKIKRLSMRHGLNLGGLRKRFCRKCLFPYSGKERIRINKGIKSVECEKCGYKNRWKIKPS